MNFFEKNLAVLEKTHSKLAEKVKSVDFSRECLIQVQSGGFDLRKKQGDLLYKGEPLRSAEELLKKVNLSHPKFTIFYGLGLGYAFHNFLEKYDKQMEACIVIERSLFLFRCSLALNDWSQILQSTKLLLVVDEADQQSVKEKFGAFISEGHLLVFAKAITPICDEVAMLFSEGDYYLEASKSIKERVDFLSSFLIGSEEDSYQAFMNVVNNIFHAHSVSSFTCLLNHFQGFPGVIVSTGPSLNQSLDWLKKIQNKAVIACADSALKILLSHGIRPHLVGCLERTECTKNFFEGEIDLKKTFLLSDLTIWPATYQKYSGPKIHYFRTIGQQRWFFTNEFLRCGGSSVAHLLYLALFQMGCSPIFLVGQDLAYDPHTQAGHAKGVHSFLEDYDKNELNYIQNYYSADKKQEVWVEGNSGKPILTNPIWNSFRSFFENLFSRELVECYNVIPKEYGACIRHAKQIEPQQALKYFVEEKDVFAVLSKRLAEEPPKSKELFIQEIKVRFQTALDYLANYKNYALDLLDSMSLFQHQFELQIYGAEVYKPLLERLEKAVQELEAFPDNKKIDFFGDFIFPQVQGEIIEIYQQLEALLKLPENSPKRVQEQMLLIRRWLKMLQYSCSRMENFILKNMEESGRQLLEEENGRL